MSDVGIEEIEEVELNATGGKREARGLRAERLVERQWQSRSAGLSFCSTSARAESTGTEPCAEGSTEGQRNHCRVKCHICEEVGELGLGSSRSGA